MLEIALLLIISYYVATYYVYYCHLAINSRRLYIR